MRNRMARVSILVLMLAAASAAGWVAWDLDRYARSVRAEEQEVAQSLDRALESVAAISAGQRAYFDAGDDLRPAFDRVSVHVQQLYRDTATVAQRARSADAVRNLNALEDSISSLVQSDAHVREMLSTGRADAASAIVSGDAAAHAAEATRQIRQLQEAEAAASRAAYDAAAWRRWAAAGIAAILVVLGIVLARTPPEPEAAPAEPAGSTVAVRPPPYVDMAAIASICTALSQATSSDAVPELLARAAAAIDASGLIVWLESGDVLAPAAAHGYDAQTIARMGTLDRSAENATADAWRTGTVHTVAGSDTSRGAVVVPLVGPERCVGVLAAEVAQGTEDDPTRLSAMHILAAQLATTLGGRQS